MQMWAKWILADGKAMWRDLDNADHTHFSLLRRTFVDETENGFHFRFPNNQIPGDVGIMISGTTLALRCHHLELWASNVNTGITFEVHNQEFKDHPECFNSEVSIQVQRKFDKDGITSPWLSVQTNTAQSILSEMFGNNTGFGFYNNGTPVQPADLAVAGTTWNVCILGRQTGISCTFQKRPEEELQAQH
jgi:hypothetical protein